MMDNKLNQVVPYSINDQSQAGSVLAEGGEDVDIGDAVESATDNTHGVTKSDLLIKQDKEEAAKLSKEDDGEEIVAEDDIENGIKGTNPAIRASFVIDDPITKFLTTIPPDWEAAAKHGRANMVVFGTELKAGEDEQKCICCNL